MRTLSEEFRKDIFDHETDEVIVALLTITHPTLPEGSIHISSDNRDMLDGPNQVRGTISNGVAYEFLPFEFVLPEEADEAQPTIQISISNVERTATQLLRATTGIVQVRVQIVAASRPDVIEMDFPDFQMISATVDAGQVVLTLNVDSLVAEPFPAGNFTPSTFGGLWATT